MRLSPVGIVVIFCLVRTTDRVAVRTACADADGAAPPPQARVLVFYTKAARARALQTQSSVAKNCVNFRTFIIHSRQENEWISFKILSYTSHSVGIMSYTSCGRYSCASTVSRKKSRCDFIS